MDVKGEPLDSSNSILGVAGTQMPFKFLVGILGGIYSLFPVIDGYHLTGILILKHPFAVDFESAVTLIVHFPQRVLELAIGCFNGVTVKAGTSDIGQLIAIPLIGHDD